jgi:hypothetical protein
MSRDDRDFIQLENAEDASSVRDRLSFLRGRRVLLIWPEEGTALTRKLELVLIQREAMRRAIRLALVTHDAEVIRHAKELNISTFETIGASERGRWKRGRSKVFTDRYQKPKHEPEPEELMEVASRVRTKRSRLSWLQTLILRLLVLLLVLGVIAALTYVVVPGATVTLVPAQQQIEASVQLTVNVDPGFTQIDVENAILPAIRLLLQVEDNATINTTGMQQLGDVQALGQVVFINKGSEAVEIPAGTTVSTSAGTPIMFRTIEAISLAAGVDEQVEVPVEAMPGSAGAVGNVRENMINTVIGPLENQVTVINTAPTTGGQSRTVNVVTAGDRDRLLAAMRQQIQERAYNEMQTMLTDTQVVIIETLSIIQERDDWTNFSAEPGDFADTLSLSMRAEVEAIAVDMQLGQQIVFARMANQIPRGRVILPDTISYRHGDVTQAGNFITFTMSGGGQVVGQINANQVRDQLAGRSLSEAMEYLTTRVDVDDKSTPKIVISPDFLDRMPILPLRINVEVQDNG